jgi:extradiol dioxygenase family protein
MLCERDCDEAAESTQVIKKKKRGKMTKSELSPFHLAFPVHSLDAARKFYGEVMGLAEGRSCESWIDFDFFGHQIVAHLDPSRAGQQDGEVRDGDCGREKYL